MQKKQEIWAGTFVLAALLLFGLFIWVLGSERQIFARQGDYYVSFSDVKGLSEGAPVRLGGLTIGRVSKISFAPSYKIPLIWVTLLINDQYRERIRTDSLVTIETQGLLGDRFVNISMTGSGLELKPGSNLKSQEPADISEVLAKAGVIVDNTTKISENVSKYLGTGKEDLLSDLSKSAKSLTDILTQIQSGDGVLHKLIYQEHEQGTVENLAKTAQDLSAVAHELRHSRCNIPCGVVVRCKVVVEVLP